MQRIVFESDGQRHVTTNEKDCATRCNSATADDAVEMRSTAKFLVNANSESLRSLDRSLALL